MGDYLKMSRSELLKEEQELKKLYEAFKARGLKLDMSRGKPGKAQLDLSMDMLKINCIEDYISESGMDSRNYGFLEGVPEARRMFADLLKVKPEEILLGGNASLTLMFNMISIGFRAGWPESEKPWYQCEKRKFICPAPGYDRHFGITEYFGFELLTVAMTENGPDMDAVEELIKDPDVKGIWCVPTYSNPDGYCYSDETVDRLANMKPAAADFRIIWDDAYLVHDLVDKTKEVQHILDTCRAAGCPNRPILFCSTSKMTFPGAGVSALAANRPLLEYIMKHLSPMSISFDKMNQLRHAHYLKDRAHIVEHMKKHRAVLWPKFEVLLNALDTEIAPRGAIARWNRPEGGYFISLYTLPGCAKRTVQLCKEGGVTLTNAGATYPYGKDPQDSNIRLAPSLPPIEDLEKAAELLCISLRLAVVEKLLQQI